MAHTTAKLIAGIRTVWVPITEPRVWDAGTAQWALELSCSAGLFTAVGKVLVDSIVAVVDAVTRAGVARGRRALPILGTRLYLCSTGSVRSQMPPQQGPVTLHSPPLYNSRLPRTAEAIGPTSPKGSAPASKLLLPKPNHLCLPVYLPLLKPETQTSLLASPAYPQVTPLPQAPSLGSTLGQGHSLHSSSLPS